MTGFKTWANKFIGRRYQKNYEVKEGICTSWEIGNQKTGIWLRCLDDDNQSFSLYRSIPQKFREAAQCNSPST